MRRLIFLLLLLGWSRLPLAAQKRTYDMDSLLRVYNDRAQPDTTRMRALQRYTWQMQLDDLDSALSCAKTLLDFSGSGKQELFLGYAENDMASVYQRKTLYALAMEHAHKAIDHWTNAGFDWGLVPVYKTMGNIMFNLSNNEKAMEYWQLALGKAEKAGFVEMTNVLYLNIGDMYLDEKKDSLALHYFLLANKMHQDLHEERGLVLDNINIASVYRDLGEADSSLVHLNAALANGKRLEMTEDLVSIYDGFAYTFLLKREYKRALDSCRKAVAYSCRLPSVKERLYASECMQAVFDSMRNADSAYHYFKKVVIYRDSVNRDNQLGVINQKETESNYLKKAAADSVRVVADKQLSEAKLDAERRTGYFLYAGIALTIVFAGFIFNRLRVTQRQKKVIEQQKKDAVEAKEIIQEKNREITDSIRYAKRIQQSQLPHQKIIDRNLERLKKKD